MKIYPKAKNNVPKIALSSRYSNYAEKLLYFAQTNKFEGIEYSILSETGKHLKTEYQIMKKLAESDLEIRYHMPYKTIELAHGDSVHAENSVQYFKECIDLINLLGGRYAIVHLGLGYRYSLQKLNFQHALKNLERVVAYGIKKNITICLENLTFGFTSNPTTFLNILENTGASAAIDIGHVVSSPVVINGNVTAENFIFEVLPFIKSAHVYDKEVTEKETLDTFHTAPQDKEDVLSRLGVLLQSDCDWWLIELGDSKEILQTTSFARDILSNSLI